MEYSEKYGRDVDEAVRLALDELGLREDQVLVTVLEEPAKGFLGMGSKMAKVRVEKDEFAGAEPEEDLTQAEALARTEKPQTKAMHDFRKKPRQASDEGFTPQSRPERSPEGRPSSRPDSRRDRDGERSERSERGGDRYDRNDRNRGRGRQGADVELHIDFSKIQRVSEPMPDLVPYPEGAAAKFLNDTLSKMGLDVTAEGFCNDECNYLEVKGPDSRIVIGKRGQTLDALQYLTNLVANRGFEKYRRVIIDVEGYRSRREKTLEILAIKMAKRVLSTGRNARLEPMNPYERKVIHATLQQVTGITTKSEGDEPYRRVIIERSRNNG